MVWNIPLKALLLLSVAMAASPAIAGATAHDLASVLPRIFWHGMCIPASQLKIPNPSPPTDLDHSAYYPGQTRGHWVYAHIPPRELEKAIPQWVEKPRQSVPGMDVFMAYDIPIVGGHLPTFAHNLYTLDGPYIDAKVIKLGHSGLYEVKPAFRYPGDIKKRMLLKIDPRVSHKPPITEWHRWYAGTCIAYKESQHYPTQCTFNYASQGIAFAYFVLGKNFRLYRQIDAFLARKVHEWRAACPG